MATDYDKFLKIQIADTGLVNKSDTSSSITPIDYVTIHTISIKDEENIMVNSQDASRQSGFVFDYQTNTRNGIMPQRFTIRGITDYDDRDVISKLKLMRRNNTIKKIKGGIAVIEQDPDLITVGDDSYLLIQLTNITFTENSGTPNTINFTIQAEAVNQ